jgi:molecular chaperone DnaJ
MDLYIVLGVQPGASIADIKRAYRRLSRRYHPGINPGDRQAEAVFRQITEAYETLTDPERRRQYDAAGQGHAPAAATTTFEFAGFDFSSSAFGPQAATFTELFAEVLHPVPSTGGGKSEQGADVHAGLTLTFEESLKGVERHVVVTRQIACGRCQGKGRIRTAENTCPQCDASGRVRWARGHMVFSKPCAACGGTGRQRQQRCDACSGQGSAVRSEAILVRVPPGVRDGTQLRVPEHGHGGRNGGRTGDLYVDVHVQPHPVVKRRGDDLFMRVPVAVHEAVLGTRIEVPTFDGPVKVPIGPGTSGGQQVRVTGRGAPTPAGGRGDLFLEIELVLPPSGDARSQELMREFARLHTEDVRKDLRL